MPDLVDDVTDLLQHLIRNACVNDGNVASGHEARSVDTLRAYLDTRRSRLRDVRARAGSRRASSRASRERDPTAPTLLLMGHTDVVPVNADRWRHDPFGGELIDGEVWGRGAVDMLNLTSSMAVAMRTLADSGFRPEGTLTYLAVADEEALGTWGAHHLVDHEWDAVRADYVITESGGHPDPIGLRAEAPGDGRREGLLLVHHHRPGHPGTRLAALADGQCPGQGG